MGLRELLREQRSQILQGLQILLGIQRLQILYTGNTKITRDYRGYTARLQGYRYYCPRLQGLLGLQGVPANIAGITRITGITEITGNSNTNSGNLIQS